MTIPFWGRHLDLELLAFESEMGAAHLFVSVGVIRPRDTDLPYDHASERLPNQAGACFMRGENIKNPPHTDLPYDHAFPALQRITINKSD